MRVVLAMTLALCACGRIAFDGKTNDGVLFRDDFQSGDLSAWGEINVTTGASLAVMAGGGHAGGNALDAMVPAIRNGAAASVTAPFALHSTGTLAFREWLFAPAPLVHFDGVMTPWSTSHHISVGADDSGRWVATEGFTGTSADDHHSTVATGIGTWQCVELDYTFAQGTAAAQIELFVDEALVLSVPAVDTAAEFTESRFGVTRADAGGAHAVIDDVVIAERHLGCN